MLKKCLAEGIGTFVLVLVACGVAVWTGNLVATALAFGLVIVAMAYSIGKISGCHINPAVSFAMAVNKKISWTQFGLYALSQTVGAICGSLMLALFCGGFEALGGNAVTPVLETAYGNDIALLFVGLVVEIVLTFIFVLAVFGATHRNEESNFAGLIIGGALTLVHLLGINLTGTSVNPARSLAPAILQAFAGETAAISQIWIFIIGPMLGGALAAIVWRLLTKNKTAEETTEIK